MRVALTVEVKARDLTGMVWLSIKLVERGHEVIIGGNPYMKHALDRIEPQVFIAPGVSTDPKIQGMWSEIKDQGGRVIAVPTEGGVFSDDTWFKEQASEMKLEHVDLYCAWGSRQAELISQVKPTFDEKIIVSGHPRFDLLHNDLRNIYEEKAKKYQERFGDYILINTNFTRAAHAYREQEHFESEQVNYEVALKTKYEEMIRSLSSDLDYSIIIRPHPVEDSSSYEHLESESSNVYVISEGNVRPWIVGATAVIHKSSTSGIESAILETPVSSYLPLKKEEYLTRLPIVASRQHTTYQELKEFLTECDGISEYSLTEEQLSELRLYFHNANDPVATPTIMDAIDSSTVSDNINLGAITPSYRERLKRISIGLFGETTTEFVRRNILRNGRTGYKKVPGISASELKTEFSLMRDLTNLEINDITIDSIPQVSNTFLIRRT